MDLSSGLWSGLPFEVVDHVLLFLPVQDLCRYRTVCKRWNRLISTPGFGALVCAQNSKQDASFIVMHYRRYHEICYVTQGWCFLDLKARRWYTIKDGDLGDRYDCYCRVMGMDGGLVCQFTETETETETETTLENRIWRQIVVYNPIAKTVKELPIVPDHRTSGCLPRLLMVVNKASLDFKILLINYEFETWILEDPTTSLEDRLLILNDPLLRVYDSATNEWRNSSIPSWIGDEVGYCASSVVFQGFLYLYVQSRDESGHPLWRYDFVRDAWERLPVVIPTKVTYNPELIVSGNRLFLVGWSGKRFPVDLDGEVESFKDDAWYFEVYEIKIPDMILDMVFELSEAFMRWLFDIHIRKNCEHLDVRVFGFGTSLMLFSNASGNSIVYDWVTGIWDYGLPQSPMGHEDPNDLFTWACGKQMNLLLPSTLANLSLV